MGRDAIKREIHTSVIVCGYVYACASVHMCMSIYICMLCVYERKRERETEQLDDN